MERLRRGDEIDGPVVQIARLRGTDAVVDARIRRGVLDLAAAGVGREDVLEMPSQPHSRLAGAGACVPRVVAGRRRLREEVEQRVRVSGPEGRVGGGNAREMIREAHGRGVAGGGGGGGAGASGGVLR